MQNKKTDIYRPANFLRFLAVPFSILLCWGAIDSLLMKNMSLSFEHWGMLAAGVLLTVTPFVMNKFLTITLFGPGIFTVVMLLSPDTQSWLNLVLFVALTLLLFKPYSLPVRISIQTLCILIILGCLYYVYQDFYKGIEHFIATGKLTNTFLTNRIKTYLPGDFSFYMAVIFIVLSIRWRTNKNNNVPRQTSDPDFDALKDLRGR